MSADAPVIKQYRRPDGTYGIVFEISRLSREDAAAILETLDVIVTSLEAEE